MIARSYHKKITLVHTTRKSPSFIPQENHSRSYHKKITRTTTLECTLGYYENLTRASRSNAGRGRYQGREEEEIQDGENDRRGEEIGRRKYEIGEDSSTQRCKELGRFSGLRHFQGSIGECTVHSRLVSRKLQEVRSVRAHSARISLSLINLLRVLTGITYTTHDSHPYHPSFARIPREYSIFNTRTPTLEHRYLPTWIVGKGEAEAYVLYFNYITFLCYTHSNYNTGTRAVVR